MALAPSRLRKYTLSDFSLFNETIATIRGELGYSLRESDQAALPAVEHETCKILADPADRAGSR